jgi:hypothetical protein
MERISRSVPGWAVVLVLFASAGLQPAHATETRVGAMGGVGYFLRDQSNVFVFPGEITQYPQMVVSELRQKNQDATYSVGAHLTLSEGLVLGAYINQPLALSIPHLPDGSSVLPGHITLDQTTDLLLGKDLGDMSLGAKLSIAFDGYTNDDTGFGQPGQLKESGRYFSLTGGASSRTMDVAGLIELPGAKTEFRRMESTWSGVGIGAKARLFMGDPKGPQFVPVAVVHLLNTSEKIDSGIMGAPQDKIDFSTVNVGLGAALNYPLNEGNLLVLGLELLGLDQSTADHKNEGKTTDRYLTTPGLYMGLESTIKPWLKGRVGASQLYQSYTHKIEPKGDPSTEESIRSTPFAMNFGLGVAFSQFTVDASFNEGLLFDGPNFVSGSAEPLARRISVTYNFK